MHCKSAARTFLATLGMLAALSPAHAHDKGVGLLLLGDGKISREPKAGNVFACQTSFRGGGAQALGPWAQNGVWKPDAKIAVNGAIAWPNAAVSIALEGNQRVVRANGLPNHPTGIFPVDRNDPAYKYDRNPNSIREQSVLLRLPAQPIASGRPSCVPMGMIGFSLTGVAIFNALGRDGPRRGGLRNSGRMQRASGARRDLPLSRLQHLHDGCGRQGREAQRSRRLCARWFWHLRAEGGRKPASEKC